MSSELAWLLAIFGGLSLVIVLAGYFMTRAADVIGHRTGIGGTLAGLILLAVATSLPELAININAVRLPDSSNGVDLALGNVLGSSIFNLLILGVIDLLFKSRQRMFSPISAAHTLSALVSMALTAIILLAILLERSEHQVPMHVYHVGLGPLICGGAYFFAARLIYLDQRMAVQAEEESPAGQKQKSEPQMSLAMAGGVYLATTVAVFIAARYMAPTADQIAEVTGLGSTFIGSTLLALTTSLPEVVTTVVAVRIGAADMAIGNIFGSNSLNVAILLPVDAFYTHGSLLADASAVHAMTAAAVILLSCVATMGILYRAEKRYWVIEPDALLVVLLALGTLWGLYALTRDQGPVSRQALAHASPAAELPGVRLERVGPRL